MLNFKDLQIIKALAEIERKQALVARIENFKQGEGFSFHEFELMLECVEAERKYLRSEMKPLEKMICAEKKNACIYDFEEDSEWYAFNQRLEACNALKEKIENVEF